MARDYKSNVSLSWFLRSCAHLGECGPRRLLIASTWPRVSSKRFEHSLCAFVYAFVCTRVRYSYFVFKRAVLQTQREFRERNSCDRRRHRTVPRYCMLSWLYSHKVHSTAGNNRRNNTIVKMAVIIIIIVIILSIERGTQIHSNTGGKFTHMRVGVSADLRGTSGEERGGLKWLHLSPETSHVTVARHQMDRLREIISILHTMGFRPEYIIILHTYTVYACCSRLCHNLQQNHSREVTNDLTSCSINKIKSASVQGSHVFPTSQVK